MTMDDGRSDRDSLPETKESAQSDFVGPDIASLTRRSFLVGAGSVAGAYATGAFAGTKATYRWSIYRAPDPREEYILCRPARSGLLPFRTQRARDFA